MFLRVTRIPPTNNIRRADRTFQSKSQLNSSIAHQDPIEHAEPKTIQPVQSYPTHDEFTITTMITRGGRVRSGRSMPNGRGRGHNYKGATITSTPKKGL